MERSIRIFLASLKSEKTKDNYLKGLERFRIAADIETLDKFVQLPAKEVQMIVEDYLLTMRETVHPNSIPTNYYPIQTFLEMNDVMINFKKMRRLFPQQVKTSVERGWTTEEIQRMLEVADDYRTIAAIHVEGASGGRIGLFENLMVRHLLAIDDEQFGKCYAMTGYAESTEEYTTFLTPEATIALDRYLDQRRATGEKIEPDSPVFVMKHKKHVMCKPTHLANTIYYVQKKAGLRDPANRKGKRYAVSSNHGFRHRFNEVVKSSNLVNAHIGEKLLSHTSKLIPMDTIYYNPKMETMFHEYKKIIPMLTINNIEQQKAENSALVIKQSEFEKMKITIEKLERERYMYEKFEKEK